MTRPRALPLLPLGLLLLMVGLLPGAAAGQALLTAPSTPAIPLGSPGVPVSRP